MFDICLFLVYYCLTKVFSSRKSGLFASFLTSCLDVRTLPHTCLETFYFFWQGNSLFSTSSFSVLQNLVLLQRDVQESSVLLQCQFHHRPHYYQFSNHLPSPVEQSTSFRPHLWGDLGSCSGSCTPDPSGLLFSSSLTCPLVLSIPPS